MKWFFKLINYIKYGRGAQELADKMFKISSPIFDKKPPPIDEIKWMPIEEWCGGSEWTNIKKYGTEKRKKELKEYRQRLMEERRDDVDENNEEHASISVQINGKEQFSASSQKGNNQNEVHALIRKNLDVYSFMKENFDDTKIKKIIFVPDKIFNIVLNDNKTKKKTPKPPIKKKKAKKKSITKKSNNKK